MDLFAKKDKSQEGTKEFTNYEIKQLGNSKLLFDFQKDCSFVHGDKITNLIKARLYEKYEKNISIAPDTAKYVCFEIPANVTVEDLANNSVFDVLNGMGKFQDLMKKNYNNIGFIDEIGNGKFKLYKPTGEVLAYTRSLDDEIPESARLLEYRIYQGMTNSSKENNWKQKLADSTKKYLREKQAKKEKNKENASIEELYRYMINNKIYTDFKAVDISDGRIIKIGRLEQLEETPEENLYSAYIHKIESENEDMLISKRLQDKPKGYPVMFTTQTKIEEIIKKSNNDQSRKFLELISYMPVEKLNVNKIEFIGSLDNEGRIIRTEENCSEIIKNKIIETKENFNIEIEQQNERI